MVTKLNLARLLQSIAKKETVTVEGLNISKKAVRPSEANPEGGIVEFEAPIHVSNVMKKEKFEARAAKKA